MIFSTMALSIISPILVANLSDRAVLDLIKRCTRKSPNWNQVWEEFEERFGKKILMYLYYEFKKYSKGYYETEYDEIIKDLRQDVYIKLLKTDGQALKNFRGKTQNSFLAYLHVISRNVVLNFIKNSYERSVTKFVRLGEMHSNTERKQIESISHETVDTMDKQFMREFIVSRLKGGYRSRNFQRDLLVFKLFYFEGHSAKEIISGCDINLSISGIETVVSRMKNYLEKSIKKKTFF